MAAISKGRALVGKLFVNQILLSPISASRSRRNVHGLGSGSGSGSTYDKNIEEHNVNVVPDYVIDSNSDKYWSPHPKTGVFGPAVSAGPTYQSLTSTGTSSVLDQKVWFRLAE